MTPLRRYWPYLTLILAPLLVLWQSVVLGKALGPFDQIRQMAPWNGPSPTQPWDVLQADGVLQFYLWRDLVFESWRSFRVPFWNPYELAGTPLLANSQSGALYPPHILIGILHVPTALAITLLAWFHLAWAGLGTYYFTRKVGGSRVGGVIAGLSFSLSAFMVAWSGLPSVPTTVSWIPWILGLVVALFRGEHVTSFISDKDPQSTRRYVRRLKFLAICFGMLILAGHLQFVAYGGMAAILLAVWLAVVAWREGAAERRKPLLKGLGGVALAGIVGVCIAAPQLMAVMNYSQFSHRQNSPTAEGYLAYQASAIQPFELIGFMHPNLMGEPTRGLSQIEGAEKYPAYWPAYVKRGANFAEGAIGLGPMVIGLLLLARRRYDWGSIGGVILVAAVAFLLATGTALGRLLYFGVPGWSATGSPGRIAVLFVLAVSVLAGVSATQNSEPEPEEKWQKYLPVAGMAVVAIASIYAVMFALGDLKSWIPQIDANLLPQFIAQSTARPKALAAVSTLVAVAAVGYWLRERRKPSWALVLGVMITLTLSVPAVLRFSDSSDLHVDGPASERIAVVNNAWDLLMAAPATLPPNTAGLSRIHELGGYDSLIHRDTVALLATVNQQDPAPPANGNMMFVKPGFDPESLADAGVREVWQNTPEGLQRIPVEGPGRASTESGPAEILRESGSEVVVRATGSRLILRDRNMPGWSATVDGKSVSLQGALWREVDLPAGESHEVAFHYVAPGYSTGLPLLMVGLLLLAIPVGGRKRAG